MQTQLQTKQFAIRNTYLRTDEAFRSWSPLHADALRETMLMPSSSAAAGFPFATTDLVGTNGVIAGVDHASRAPVMVDRFSWDTPHLVRVGRTGSGKTYATKLELIRSVLAIDDLQVVVIDPKDEYAAVIKALGGTVQPLADTQVQELPDGLLCVRVPDIAASDKAERLTPVLEDIYRATS